jgi:hypothetical protein
MSLIDILQVNNERTNKISCAKILIFYLVWINSERVNFAR